jgi:uncharacterized protein (DUF934 family)
VTDETKTGKAGTGVAKQSVATVIRPETMILDKAVVASFTTLLMEPDPNAAAEPGTCIPLAGWLARRAAGQDLRGVGVIANGADDISALEPHLADVPVVALQFPVFSDGRAYSHAYRLRKTWRYPGPIIAFGDVLRDQILYMSRVGINGFYMRADQKLDESLAAFRLYSAYYQYNDVAR